MSDRSPQKIFVSSTAEDLQGHRAAVRDALVQAGRLPIMQEYFVASGKHPPYEACMQQVDAADALIVVVAHRYGWVPPDQPDGGVESITWLECLRAADQGKEILAFLVAEKYDWPDKLKEQYGAIAAMMGAGDLTIDEVRRNVEQLNRLKKWLNNRGIRASFTTPDSLKAAVTAALGELEGGEAPRPARADLSGYLTWLCNDTAYINVRALQVGSGKPTRFKIDDLYAPLTIQAPVEQRRGRSGANELAVEMRSSTSLDEALKSRHVVIRGDAGSGKSTFLRRIAHALAETRLGSAPEAAHKRLGMDEAPLPLLIRIGDLIQHCQALKERQDGPVLPDRARWLTHFLAHAGEERDWNLREKAFKDALKNGEAILLMDGLDEAPDRRSRAAVARLLEDAVHTYPDCRFVVTTRPRAYEGEATLDGFRTVDIEPLGPEAIEDFLRQWCTGLFPDDPAGAKNHQSELQEALRAKSEIRRMARSPVMLTALAALYWNDKRLPDERAELYESILTWLLRSREDKPDRVDERTARKRLMALALAMQTRKGGRVTQLPRREAAELIEAELGGVKKEDRIEAAERFLMNEESDSGILTSAGHDVRFAHLTFQEYLAARAIGQFADLESQLAVLLEGERLYRTEWRETALLFGGVLHEQGQAKLDRLVRAVLLLDGTRATLASKAQAVGALGSIVRDLAGRSYRPAVPEYEETVREVEAIFDPERSNEIELAVRIEAADALGRCGDRRFQDENALWVQLPGGRFRMGAQSGHKDAPNYDPDAGPAERPVHEVELSPFEIGRYPVTVGEYARFVDAGGYAEAGWWKHDWRPDPRSGPDDWESQIGFPTRPVTELSWHEAAAYCEWRSAESGRTVRLPTEAEWEYAARGKDGRRYPWGAEPPNQRRASYHRTGPKHATPVGLYRLGATPEAIEELAGNVWEWCWDWHGEYPDGGQIGPIGPSQGEFRTIRGGSWYYNATYLRWAVRNRNEPDFRVDVIGFRCVREVST